MLSDMIGVRKKHTVREKLFLLLGYERIARRTRAKKGTGLGAQRRSQMDEARGKLGGIAKTMCCVLVD